MHNTVQVVCASEKDRAHLRGVFAAVGADAVFAADMNDALAVFDKVRPAAVFFADGEEPPAEVQLREFRRAAPFLPLVPLLRRRDAGRAVALMKAGAFDCLQAPWTAEALRPVYRKALRLSGTSVELDSMALRSRRRSAALALAAFFAFCGFAGGSYYGFKRFSPRASQPHSFRLPYAHPTGIVIKEGSALISDWYSQGLYEHDLKNFGIRRVTSLPESTPVAMTRTPDSLWMAEADGTLHRRLLDAGYTPVSKTPRFSPAPDSVCYDGLYFWTADSRTGAVTKRMPDDQLTPLKTYRYPGAKLGALTCDTRFLWVADPGYKALVKMSLDDPEKVLTRTDIKAYASKTLKITAAAAKDGKIWFAGEDGEKGLAFSEDEPK